MPSYYQAVLEDRPQLPMLYFCIPQNDKMLDHWDTVADRLYKIRHCMNIEGVARQLALSSHRSTPQPWSGHRRWSRY